MTVQFSAAALRSRWPATIAWQTRERLAKGEDDQRAADKALHDAPFALFLTPAWGSLLRPHRLQQARMQRQRKNITAERLREIEDDCIREGLG